MFNHYAKLKRILVEYGDDWYIVKVNEPTTTKRFNGEVNHYDYFYRLYSQGEMIKYGKFQQLDTLAGVLNVPIEVLETRVFEKNLMGE